ncbi:hypothetical protein TIFTF001_005686 [Ficus carica]|uniref:LOB domain-containing protein n=1 Tax=Ficus carica TaxID=3494 RepID=A0AA87ZKA8_FICCA|nr:hypothetical protein TIFTF001_005686 [Ficus carica]
MSNSGGGEWRAKPFTACCACRHGHKRCRPDCFLKQYFPPEKQAEFEAVRRFFGIRNFIEKVTGHKEATIQSDTAKSIIQEALIRSRDLSGGWRCIKISEVELDTVNAQLESYPTINSFMAPSSDQGILEPFPAMINNQYPLEDHFQHLYNYYQPIPSADPDHAQTQLNPASFEEFNTFETIDNTNLAQSYYDPVRRDDEFAEFQEFQDYFNPESTDLGPPIEVQDSNYQNDGDATEVNVPTADSSVSSSRSSPPTLAFRSCCVRNFGKQSELKEDANSIERELEHDDMKSVMIHCL